MKKSEFAVCNVMALMILAGWIWFICSVGALQHHVLPESEEPHLTVADYVGPTNFLASLGFTDSKRRAMQNSFDIGVMVGFKIGRSMSDLEFQEAVSKGQDCIWSNVFTRAYNYCPYYDPRR